MQAQTLLFFKRESNPRLAPGLAKGMVPINMVFWISSKAPFLLMCECSPYKPMSEGYGDSSPPSLVAKYPAPETTKEGGGEPPYPPDRGRNGNTRT